MILVIGGLNGFVGSNTTEALVNLGKDCVVTKHKDTEVPEFLQRHIDNHRVIVEQADATSIDDLRRIGEKHNIDGIVNVAGGFKTPNAPVPGLRILRHARRNLQGRPGVEGQASHVFEHGRHVSGTLRHY